MSGLGGLSDTSLKSGTTWVWASKWKKYSLKSFKSFLCHQFTYINCGGKIELQCGQMLVSGYQPFCLFLRKTAQRYETPQVLGVYFGLLFLLCTLPHFNNGLLALKAVLELFCPAISDHRLKVPLLLKW